MLVPSLAIFCFALLLNDNNANPRGMFFLIAMISTELFGITIVTLLHTKNS